MSVFTKFEPCCSYEPPSRFHDGYSPFELLNTLINMINDFIDYLNSVQSQFDAKEDSDDITNNRKLSENGDFAGTWFGDTYTKITTDIAESLLLSQTMIDAINARESIGLIYDGDTFPYIDGIDVTIDGGVF